MFYISAESTQQVSNKKLIIVFGIIVLLTAITFISIALYSNTAAGDTDSNSDSNGDTDSNEDCDEDDEPSGWACLLQDIPEYFM